MLYNYLNRIFLGGVIMEKLIINKTTSPKEKPACISSFGTIFTDHMVVMEYTKDKGWHNLRIEPYGPVALDPSACVLHYGQGVFEGLKAYKTKEGKVQLFRARDNFERLNRSCRKVCIPEVDVDLLMLALSELLKLEYDWIPNQEGTSLYIRPFIIASEAFLGVRPAIQYKLFIILSPVGAYYPEGLKPVKILVEEKYVRAVRGGLGEAKTMANYAASLLAAEEAKQKGFSQVLWLDGVERKYVEEVGTMNIFFKINGTVITPALNGSILPGITRDSVIKVLKKWGIPVEERRISIDEVVSASQDGSLEEIFGTGTAAVISPVGKMSYNNEEILLDNYDSNSLAIKLYNYITGLQYGTESDEFNWVKNI
ncbi:MAG: branched-chain amino acid aminotransferase [Clostridia bacterium]|jgi:branched-chain amino acid aminotransferase|nr:branched-chain amino acid aminotransferase [Clostridia bacterium]MDN5323079.1 branched-chain amino acid aminotransferase [Clostridia bacterium]